MGSWCRADVTPDFRGEPQGCQRHGNSLRDGRLSEVAGPAERVVRRGVKANGFSNGGGAAFFYPGSGAPVGRRPAPRQSRLEAAAATMCSRVLVLLAACVVSGAALRCYQCNSRENGYCSDAEIHRAKIPPAVCPFDLVEAISQGLGLDPSPGHPRAFAFHGIQEPALCQKIYYSNPRGGGFVERKCVLRNSHVCEESGTETPYGRADYCGTCGYDGCNGASRPGRHRAWLLLLAPLAAFLRWC
ncbi:uncharacterized protein LOC134542890 [Bacillus rossius redtenbacheri]|uniref:uncharacterized protein LOC134542890 n=1 Tax=Bacillus rossius redtenbacheri TaxID=93214 RepID=UPI002FDDD716